MNFEEYISYATDRLCQQLGDNHWQWSDEAKRGKYFDSVANSLFNCFAFLDKFYIDEGEHNYYDHSNFKIDRAEKKELFLTAAKAIGAQAKLRCTENHQEFYARRYNGQFTTRKYCEAYIRDLSTFKFERKCKKCGSNYRMQADLRTYRLVAIDEPETCRP